MLCELLANNRPQRYERAALRWLEQFINELLPPLTEVALAASALAELRHGNRNTGVETLKRLLRHG
jgi:succinylglutamate desuccinylase